MPLNIKQIFNKHLLLISVICLCLMPDIVNAKTDDVEKALKVFNANNSVEAANNFLQAIYKADFLDEEIILPTDATTSTIRSQVWYWAAEWYYDKQKYALAKDYALKMASSDDNQKASYDRKIKTTIIAGVSALVTTQFVSWILGYFK